VTDDGGWERKDCLCFEFHSLIVSSSAISLRCWRHRGCVVAAVLRQICTGLAYLHSHKIAHCDLKPVSAASSSSSSSHSPCHAHHTLASNARNSVGDECCARGD